MEYIYSYLEEEAMDISEDARVFGHITRQGSTEELSVFAAEFNILDEQLSTLVETLVIHVEIYQLQTFITLYQKQSTASRGSVLTIPIFSPLEQQKISTSFIILVGFQYTKMYFPPLRAIVPFPSP